MICPAQFTVKKLLYFPEIEISSSDTQYKREEVAKTLRQKLMKLKKMPPKEIMDVETEDNVDFIISKKKKKEEILVVLKFVTNFPPLSNHQFHHEGQVASLIEPLDEKLRDHVKKIVRGGVRWKAEILSRTAEYVNNRIISW